MLSNIVLVILGFYIIMSPFMMLYSVKLGFKMGQRPEKTAAEPVIPLPKRKKEPQVSKEVKRGFDILNNIDIYDGTSNGQKEIKNEQS